MTKIGFSILVLMVVTGCATTYSERFTVIHYDQTTHRDVVLDTQAKRVWECTHEKGRPARPTDKSCKRLPFEQFYGEIHIKSQPSRATVFLDGSDIKTQTPIIIDRVPREQTHTLVLKLKGYKNWEQTVDLKTEGKITYEVSLQKE